MRGFEIRFIKREFLLAGITAVLLVAFGFAQEPFAKLYRLYSEHQIPQLKQEIEKPAYSAYRGTPELLFFKSILNRDAEAAVADFERVFKQGGEKIKRLAAQKLYQYFYAKGFYVTAQNYQKYLVEHQPVEPPEQVQPAEKATDVQPAGRENFYIQVGAFGIKENAEQRRRFLKTQDIPTTLVKRNVNGKTLFCVWVKGKQNLETTIKYAERLKQKFDLNYQIMKK